MRIIGIDPGASGGIGYLTSTGVAAAWKMPDTERDIYDLIEGLTDGLVGLEEVVAYIEKVHSRPRQGVSSTFKFGMGYGGLRMALVALKIPFHEVTPQQWQKKMGCMSHGDKNITKAAAQRLYPGIKVTHALADSLLIARYGWEVER